jgi:hypothetical protein
MINNMTFIRVAKKCWVCWQVTFRRAAREEEDDGQEKGWACDGRYSENGWGVNGIQNFGSGLFCCLPRRTDKLAN